MRDSTLGRAAKDQTVRFPIVPSYAAADIAAAATGPDPSASTIGSDTLTISKSRSTTFFWEGEEQIGVGSSGIYQNILQQQFAQGMRTLVNEIEADLAALYIYGSRAFGTAGTAPFASLLDTADILKILLDNGAPTGDLHLIVDTSAGANLRRLGQLTKANEAGGNETLRRGTLMDLNGFMVGESGQVKAHTKGTATGFDCTAIEPVGETTVACDGSNSGTVLAGDIVTRGVEGGSAADANKYVVASGSTLTGNAAGNFILNATGVRVATAVTDEWTIGASYRANMAFARSAIALVTRVPAMPEGGDAASDVIELQDPISGLAFQIAMYRQRRRVAFEVGIAWGVKAVKPEHIAILLG
jgi:hypothetical protein